MNSAKCVLFFLWRCGPTWAHTSLFLKITDNTQRRTAVGRTPLHERSDRRRDLYLTTQNTHNRHELTVLRAVNMHVNLTNVEMLQNLLMVVFFGLRLYLCDFSPLGLSARVCSQIEMDYPLRRFMFNSDYRISVNIVMLTAKDTYSFMVSWVSVFTHIQSF